MYFFHYLIVLILFTYTRHVRCRKSGTRITGDMWLSHVFNVYRYYGYEKRDNLFFTRERMFIVHPLSDRVPRMYYNISETAIELFLVPVRPAASELIPTYEEAIGPDEFVLPGIVRPLRLGACLSLRINYRYYRYLFFSYPQIQIVPLQLPVLYISDVYHTNNTLTSPSSNSAANIITPPSKNKTVGWSKQALAVLCCVAHRVNHGKQGDGAEEAACIEEWFACLTYEYPSCASTLLSDATAICSSFIFISILLN